MNLDIDRSGHFRENMLALTFSQENCDIGIELNEYEVKELLNFLLSMLEVEK